MRHDQVSMAAGHDGRGGLKQGKYLKVKLHLFMKENCSPETNIYDSKPSLLLGFA